MSYINKDKDSIELHSLKYRNPVTRKYELAPIALSEYTSLIARTKERLTIYFPEDYKTDYKNSLNSEYIPSIQLGLFVLGRKENVEFYSENLRVQFRIANIHKSKTSTEYS